MAAPRLEMGTSTPATGNFAGTTTAMAFTVIEDQGQAIASQHLLETSGWGFVAQIVRGGGRKMQDSGAWMWHGQHAFELRRVRTQILIEGSVEVRGELRVPPTPGAPVWRLLLDSGAEVHVVDKAQAAMYLNPLTGRGPNLRGVGDCHKISVARASLVLTANPGMSQGRSDKGRVLSGPLELPNPCFALHPLAPEAAGAHVVKLIDTVRVTANKGGKGYVEDLTAHERILDLATKAGDRGAPTRAPTTAECEAMWTAWLSEGASISATDAAHWTEARAPAEASPLPVLAAADSGASTGAGHSARRGGGQGSRRDKDGRSGGGGDGGGRPRDGRMPPLRDAKTVAERLNITQPKKLRGWWTRVIGATKFPVDDSSYADEAWMQAAARRLATPSARTELSAEAHRALQVGREWLLDACPPLSPDRLIDPGDAVPLLMVDRSEGQGREAVVGGRVHLGALGLEEPHDLEVALLRSHEEGHDAVVGGRVRLGALGLEEPHDLEVAFLRSDVQGRVAVLVGRVYLGALGLEEPHDLEEAIARSDVQDGAALVVDASADVDARHTRERFHRLPVLGLRRGHELGGFLRRESNIERQRRNRRGVVKTRVRAGTALGSQQGRTLHYVQT